MFDKKETTPLLPLVSSSPPPSTFLTDIHNHYIEDKPSTMPNSPVTPPAPAGPTPPATPTWAQIVNLFTSTPRWVNPANGERSQEAQAKIDHDDQANQQANKQTAWALVFLIVKGTFLLLMIWHAAPLAKTKTLNTTAARDTLIEDVRNDLFNDVTNEARDKLIQKVRDLVYNDVMGSVNIIIQDYMSNQTNE